MTLDNKLREILWRVYGRGAEQERGREGREVLFLEPDEALAIIKAVLEKEGYVAVLHKFSDFVEESILLDGQEYMTGKQWYDKFEKGAFPSGVSPKSSISAQWVVKAAKKAAGLE